MQKVWPGTFVEESNLAYNVFALRKALGDPADHAQYIETVLKRGYRFCAPVNAVLEDHGVAPAEAAGGLPGRARNRSLFGPRWMLIGGVCAILAVAVVFARSRRAESITQPIREVPLTSVHGGVRAPSLSPDATQVVFAWTGEGRMAARYAWRWRSRISSGIAGDRLDQGG